VLPGTHWIYVDRNDIVWGTENWAHNIYRFDPRNERIQENPMEGFGAVEFTGGWQCRVRPPTDSSGGARDKKVSKVDAMTGEPATSYVLKKFASTYGSAMSKDGRYSAAAHGRATAWSWWTARPERCSSPTPAPIPDRRAASSIRKETTGRGGRGGMLVKFDTTQKRIHEYRPPTPTCRSIPHRSTRTARSGRAKCMPADMPASTPKPRPGRNMCCPSPMNRSRNLDRQFDQSGHCLVRSITTAAGADSADGIGHDSFPPLVIVRLDRTIQYAAACAIDAPLSNKHPSRITGSPAFAEDDTGGEWE